MTIAEAKAEYARLAQVGGLDSETTAAVLKAMDNPAFAQQVVNNFVPRSDFSKELDRKDAEKRAEVQRYEEYYATKVRPAYDNYVKSEAELKAYKLAYGDIDQTAPNRKVADENQYMTPDQVKALLAAEREAMQNSVLALNKITTKAANEYFHQYKKPFDVDEFEAFAIEGQKAGRYSNLNDAYAAYSKAEREGYLKTQQETRDKKIADDAVKDYASRHKLPVDSKPQEKSFIREVLEAPVPKGDANPDMESKNAFTEGWNSYEDAKV